MNDTNDQLMRLFRAARKPETESVAIPYELETRVLAAWRAPKRNESWFGDTALLWRGLAAAIAITAACCWPLLSQSTSTDPLSEYVQQADTSLATDVSP